MAQDDYNIPNQSFPSFRSDLNSALSAINTTNSGTSRPSSAVAGTIWLDTSGGVTAYVLKFFDGSDDISLANINTTANTVDWIDSSVVADIVGDTSPQLGGNLDVNGNSIVSASNGNISITPNGSGKVIIDGISHPTADGTANQILTTNGSGVLSFADASGGGTEWQSAVKTANFTAVAGEGYFVNTSGGAFEIDLPTSPSVGDEIEFVDFSRTFGTNALTLDQGSNKFQSRVASTAKAIFSTSGQSIRIVYSGSTQGWIPISDDDVIDGTDPSYSANFLVVAGAGGGAGGDGGNGGGGAGGYRLSYGTDPSGGGGSSETALALTPGTVYTVTIGGGGAGHAASPAGGGTAGDDSSITGSDITNIVSAGGGAGGYSSNNKDGGSGGGSNSPNVAGGSGTTNQGFDGGLGGTAGSGGSGGGGGGASAVGGNGSTNSGGAGGAGVATTISGSSVTRAGGGGAGADSRYSGASGGSGGAGGGGAGTSSGSSNAGTTNTGSGGGAGGTSNGGFHAGSAGGSGVVILRMLTSNYSGTTSGSPTVTTSGSDTIITFNASGSYTG